MAALEKLSRFWDTSWEPCKFNADSCLTLEEINLSGTRIPQETVSFLCKNLPENLLKISLGYLKVTDENIQDLVNRCCKMMEIDLHGTDITNEAVTAMIQGV